MELKEAIEKIKFIVENNTLADSENQAIDTVLQALEELEKENGKLTRARKWFIEHTVGQIATPEMLRKILADEYIHKDKIKNKIEEIKTNSSQADNSYFMNDYKLEILEELLKGE